MHYILYDHPSLKPQICLLKTAKCTIVQVRTYRNKKKKRDEAGTEGEKRKEEGRREEFNEENMKDEKNRK
jgi:hypothetical protein